jgi:hypothetical protein
MYQLVILANADLKCGSLPSYVCSPLLTIPRFGVFLFVVVISARPLCSDRASQENGLSVLHVLSVSDCMHVTLGLSAAKVRASWAVCVRAGQCACELGSVRVLGFSMASAQITERTPILTLHSHP